jgi:hypothetical protein
LRLKSVPEGAATRRLSRFAKGSAIAAAGVLVVGAGIALGDSKPNLLRSAQSIEVHAEPIAAFDKIDVKKSRFGKLTWRGGLVLTSPSPNFGGWSALALDKDGHDFLAVSDAGTWMMGVLEYDGDKPKALRAVRIGPVLGAAGETLEESEDRDAEGVALVEGTTSKGRALVSFERNHRIGWLDVDKNGLSPVRRYLPLPEAMQDAEDNRGLEAVTLLRDGPYKGSVVAIAERLLDDSGNHTGWIWVNGKPQAFHLVNGDGYDITDAAALPNGGLLVLERRFRVSEGVKTRLRLIRQDELRPGALVHGENLLDASMNQEIDNMEGLAVHAGAGGAIIVTLISDDNFNHSLQRTLLLQFALDAVDLASAGARP